MALYELRGIATIPTTLLWMFVALCSLALGVLARRLPGSVPGSLEPQFLSKLDGFAAAAAAACSLQKTHMH